MGCGGGGWWKGRGGGESSGWSMGGCRFISVGVDVGEWNR